MLDDWCIKGSQEIIDSVSEFGLVIFSSLHSGDLLADPGDKLDEFGLVTLLAPVKFDQPLLQGQNEVLNELVVATLLVVADESVVDAHVLGGGPTVIDY